MNFENLPKKDHYRFKEVTSLTGVKPYVLRFWESEFPQISPEQRENGDKVYSKNDLECIERIRDLLFQDKLSIPQAKMYLDKEIRENEPTAIIAKETNADEPLAAAPVKEAITENFNTEPPKVMYKGVETKASIGSLFSDKNMSVKDLQHSLKQDLDAHKEILFQKNFNDEDVLRLVQAKKKLGAVLGKIDSIIEAKKW